MRRTELVVVAFALVLFFLAGPLTARKEHRIQKEEVRQEQIAEEEPFNENSGETYRVTYRPSGTRENSVADILWLKKAAGVAMDAGIPHFNVKKKKISRVFNPKLQRQMNFVDGVIELDNDPMKAEYDANEILSLVLPELSP